MPPARKGALKVYDRAYFERWYRNPKYAVVRDGVHRRRVALAVAAAEYLLERPLESVLDVGCGEAPWRAWLRRRRPKARYLGVDSSEYAVRRFGRRRNIHHGTLGGLGRLGLSGPYDLVVCSDVLHYVSTAEARRGLTAIERLLGGVAFLEVFTREDRIEGDRQEFQQRSRREYDQLFRHAHLRRVGLHLYVGRRMTGRLTSFELGAP